MQRLMAQRDIRSGVRLGEVIEEKTGNSYAHQSMSKYAAGDRITSREFIRDFATALDLNDDERTELAVQYAYHSLPEREEYY